MKLLLSLALAFAITSCGQEEAPEAQAPTAQAPAAPVVKPLPPIEAGEFSESIAPLLKKYCARCHTEDFITDETAFLTSNARKRVGNKSMPLVGSAESKTLSQKDRDTLANFK